MKTTAIEVKEILQDLHQSSTVKSLLDNNEFITSVASQYEQLLAENKLNTIDLVSFIIDKVAWLDHLS